MVTRLVDNKDDKDVGKHAKGYRLDKVPRCYRSGSCTRLSTLACPSPLADCRLSRTTRRLELSVVKVQDDNGLSGFVCLCRVRPPMCTFILHDLLSLFYVCWWKKLLGWTSKFTVRLQVRIVHNGVVDYNGMWVGPVRNWGELRR